MTVSVSASDLFLAFDFVSFGAPSENAAYISLDTGKIYWQSDSVDVEEEDLPDDLETSDRYLALPHSNELELGRRLAMAFVNRELPEDADTVAGIFRRRGAYARFKRLLDDRGLLNQWHEFEERAKEMALRAWCEENDIQIVDEPRGTGEAAPPSA